MLLFAIPILGKGYPSRTVQLRAGSLVSPEPSLVRVRSSEETRSLSNLCEAAIPYRPLPYRQTKVETHSNARAFHFRDIHVL